MEISVKEEIINPCGAERNTLWMEIAFDTSLSSLSIADQLHLVNVVSKFLILTEVVESGMEHKPGNDSVTIMWKVSCEEIDEDAIDVLEKMLTFDESDSVAISGQKLFGWELRKGTLLSRKQRNNNARTDIMSQLSGFITNEPYINFEAITSKSKTTTRSTRSTKKDDTPPVRLHSLQTFNCIRGMMCECKIPMETFIDMEDGDTRSLSLSVYPIVADNNWLTLDRKNKLILHGISLKTGDFEFRLEARDSANQMTSAPFRVTVILESPTNHLFILDVDHSSERLAKDPDILCAFAEKLANSLGDRFPGTYVRRQARVTFSNSSLSYKYCQKKAIDAIKHIMLTRRRDRIRAEFVRSMDSRFHVRNVKLEFQGSCIEKLPTSRFPANISLSTSTNVPDHDTSSVRLWLPIALIAFLKFFLATLALVCCLIKRKKAKAVQSEYISKGLPVVFPEEIPQDDETATVSTPMLVKEERPPLIISQHENPLYKPPPPLSTASSPRPRNAFTNQRQPPPYVPP
ncbi:BMA-DGN-1 [Dirofilaria immitis]|nr:BMA-DGN-1 [Dirofilaria immitis]